MSLVKMSAKPPLPPLSTRPNAITPSQASTHSSPPPAVNVNSRPVNSRPTVSNPSSPLSSSVPLPARSEEAITHSASHYPPSNLPSQLPAPSAMNDFSFPQPNRGSSSPPYGPQTMPGFPSPTATHEHFSQQPRPWSQAPWPPPEWIANSSHPGPHHSPVPYAVYSGRTSSHSPGYTPAYLQVSVSPPFPLEAGASTSSSYPSPSPQSAQYEEPYFPQARTEDPGFPQGPSESRFNPSSEHVPFPGMNLSMFVTAQS